MNKEKLFRILKKGGRLGLAVLAFLTACGVKPTIVHTIEQCGGETEVDAAPGIREQISAPGVDIQYEVNPDGSVTYFSRPPFTDNPPSQRDVGDPYAPHLNVNLQGDTDSDGRQNMIWRSVCPLPTPSPSSSPSIGPDTQPTPAETPTGLLPGSQGKISLGRQGFYPGRASKPVGRIPSFSGRGRF